MNITTNTLIYIYILVIILCWTSNPFIKKYILKNDTLTNDEYFIINHFMITLILAFYFFYLYKKKKCSPECLKKLNRYDIIYIFLGSITSIIGARLILNVIKFKDVSYVVAHIQPIIIALSFIIGYLFFSEQVTVYKIIGISLVILGILMLNKKTIN